MSGRQLHTPGDALRCTIFFLEIVSSTVFLKTQQFPKNFEFFLCELADNIDQYDASFFLTVLKKDVKS